MEYWILDVKMTVSIKGKDVAFDYLNTHFDKNEAIKEAKLLSENEDVLSVSVHHWYVDEEGHHEHYDTGTYDDVPYSFINRSHRELNNKEGNYNSTTNYYNVRESK